MIRQKFGIKQAEEQNYRAMEITALSDWLKNLALVFQPMRNKPNEPVAPCTRDFPRAFSKLDVIPIGS